MRITIKNLVSKRWYLDIFCVVLMFGLNPIIHFINCSPKIFSPDTIAYVTMGRDLFSKGLFYIPSWAHVNNGLIYPPLYPFFIACGNLFLGEALKMAEWVSCLCALAASIPTFLYLRETTNRVVAVLTVFLIQINLYYFSFGMRPLSEATFVLTLSWTMFLTLLLFRNSMSNRRGLSLIVGLSCALVFLSRQIGIAVFIFLLAFFLLQGVTSYRTERRAVFKNALFMAMGWLIVIAPYTLIIYHQTGHHPLQQNFSMAKYEVTTDDPQVLMEIKQIESIPDKSYSVIYAKRRFLRKLLPDSSEMLYRVNRKNKEKAKYLNYFISTLGNPKHFLSKIYNNIMYLRDPLGGFILGTFFLFCLSTFFVKSERVKLLNRLLLPLFICFYLLIVSCFTDKISRYSHILFPFVLMHIAGELFICFHVITRALKIKLSALVFFFVVYAFFLFATPQFFTALRIFPKLEDTEAEFYSLRKQVEGEPVFSLSPLSSYLSGGSCRLLPNDSLEKVVKYGKKTGVRWLLVSRTQSALSETRLYTNAQWYWKANLERDYPNLVRFCCKTADGSYILYEIF